MESWTPSTTHPGYIEKTIKRAGVTITILRPKLTDKERDKANQNVEAALSSFVRNQILHNEVTV